MADDFLAGSKDRQGFIGPSDMGKSYAFLYTYLQLRSSENSVVVYINNPEKATTEFSESLVKDLNGYESRRYLKQTIPELKDEDDLFKILWALYIGGSGKDISVYKLVLHLLRGYCESHSLDFILMIDHFNVLFHYRWTKIECRAAWNNLLICDKSCFKKVSWMASFNKEFNLNETGLPEIFCYYTEKELKEVIRIHIDDMSLAVKKNWEDNLDEICMRVKEYTNAIPFEVDWLLKAKGSTIHEKLKAYVLKRKFNLSSCFGEFRSQTSFKPYAFFAILPLENISDDFKKYLSKKVIRLVFDKKRSILRLKTNYF